MRSRWLVASAVLGGVVAAPVLAWLFLVVFAAFAYGRFEEGRDWVAVAFLVFTLLTVPIAVLVVWTGNHSKMVMQTPSSAALPAGGDPPRAPPGQPEHHEASFGASVCDL